MKNFNGKDIYAISYGSDSAKCTTLYAINNRKLMLFNEHSSKNDAHKSIDYPVPVSSVSVCKKFVSIGFQNGMLKILLNNEQKKVNFKQ